ncbi:MAG: hypothetical protein NTV63_02605 [Candidatus Woesearchaeota archaeon]|nr:hypothetical protein [Candidatus Woesearchaeota archaeon]
MPQFNERTLLKIAFFSAIAGIIALFIISEFSIPPFNSIFGAEGMNENERVRITGIVSDAKITKSGILLNVSATESILVMVKNPAALKIAGLNGSEVEVIGRISIFKGKNEISADKVEIIAS